MDKRAKPVPKKPYSKPTLTLYGTVRELTGRGGHTASLDGQGQQRTG